MISTFIELYLEYLSVVFQTILLVVFKMNFSEMTCSGGWGSVRQVIGRLWPPTYISTISLFIKGFFKKLVLMEKTQKTCTCSGRTQNLKHVIEVTYWPDICCLQYVRHWVYRDGENTDQWLSLSRKSNWAGFLKNNYA